MNKFTHTRHKVHKIFPHAYEITVFMVIYRHRMSGLPVLNSFHRALLLPSIKHKTQAQRVRFSIYELNLHECEYRWRRRRRLQVRKNQLIEIFSLGAWAHDVYRGAVTPFTHVLLDIVKIYHSNWYILHWFEVTLIAFLHVRTRIMFCLTHSPDILHSTYC